MMETTASSICCLNIASKEHLAKARVHGDKNSLSICVKERKKKRKLTEPCNEKYLF